MSKKLNFALPFTIGLTFIVIVLGAYTRLKDAGLGCPDWPGCYGRIFAPSAAEIFSQTASTKAWIEMIHRYVAGTLSLLILYIAIQGLRLRNSHPRLWIVTTALFCLLIYQALLGMWTVTMFLNPIVVMGHLLGGLAILATLWWIYLRLHLQPLPAANILKNTWRVAAFTTCIAILQIALGGWTSANYAALVCTDFPYCHGQFWPALPLDLTNKITIQMTHRLGAYLTAILCAILAIKLISSKQKICQILGKFLVGLVAVQIVLGIANVMYGLPLIISLAHSAIAACLLLCLISIVYVTHAKPNH